MSNISNLLNEAQSSWNKQKDETKHLVNKWNKTGLLEGIDKEYEKHNTAILLENQAKQLVTEASTTNGGGTSAAEDWNGVALPLVRRIFGEIAAKDFVSVQPMNLPSGLVFWLDFKYGTTVQGDSTVGNKFTQGTDLMGDTSSSSTPTGGLYGKGKAGFSANQSQSTITATATSASWADVGYDGALSASIEAGEIKKFTWDISTVDLDRFDSNMVQSMTISASANIAVASQLAAYNYVQAGNVYAFVSASTGGATPGTSKTEVFYSLTPDTSIERGDWEGTGASDSTDLNIPEVNVQLRQEALVAKTRKLKVIWTPEFAQDLNAYHSIDAEAELTSMLSEYISMEIDLEILEMITDAALHEEKWQAELGKVAPASAGAGVGITSAGLNDISSAGAYTQQSWFATLGTKMQKISNKIHSSTMRGGANFVVCSPDVATVIESIPGYSANTTGTESSFAMGVSAVGSMNNRFTVYKNPYWQDNVLVMGFRGSQFLETGAVYAPYIPLIMTPLVYDPKNFTPRKGVMTRYAKKVVRPEFYGKIMIGGLNTL